MKKILTAVAMVSLVSACATRTYEKETVVERPVNRSSTVVVPQGSTSSSGTTVVVPQNAPPAGETTVIVPR